MTEEKSAICEYYIDQGFDLDYVMLVNLDGDTFDIPKKDLTKVIEVLFKKLEEIEKGEIDNDK